MKAAVIVAGGSSLRYGQDKLREDVLGRSVLQRSVDAFCGLCDVIVVVGSKVDGTVYAPGGQTRSESVRNGLAALSNDCKLVAVHDGARPFVCRTLVSKLFDEASRFGSAVPYVSVADTCYVGSKDATVAVDRNDLMAVQTPQVFDYAKLVAAFSDNVNYTDESSLWRKRYGDVHFCEGQRSNKKITYAGDVPQYRVGQGFDVHAFCKGDAVVLGGVKIPFCKKLEGHSDADVLTHAICDAVLSASDNKDIGHQFPDTDDAYLGANSILLLQQCVNLAFEKGFAPINVSAVVVCEQPKIAPHIDEMKQILAETLGVSVDCVNISATTTEHLGALGKGDGIAATATALLLKID